MKQLEAIQAHKHVDSLGAHATLDTIRGQHSPQRHPVRGIAPRHDEQQVLKLLELNFTGAVRVRDVEPKVRARLCEGHIEGHEHHLKLREGERTVLLRGATVGS